MSYQVWTDEGDGANPPVRLFGEYRYASNALEGLSAAWRRGATGVVILDRTDSGRATIFGTVGPLSHDAEDWVFEQLGPLFTLDKG